MAGSQVKSQRGKFSPKALRELRDELGMNQREFASLLMVSAGAVALWELGEREIPGPVIRLCELLGRRELRKAILCFTK